MSLPQMLRVAEQDRGKLAWMLVPFTIIFLAIGVVSVMNYLHAARYRGPGWLIIVVGIVAAHLTSVGLAYLGWSHRVPRSGRHWAIHGIAVAFSAFWLLLGLIAYVVFVGIH